MHADNLGDIFHLQWFDVLRTVVEKLGLFVHDRLGHLLQRAVPLFDRINQPAGRLDFTLDELAGGRVWILFQHLEVAAADPQLRNMLIQKSDRPLAVVILVDCQFRADALNRRLREPPARVGVERPHLFDGGLDGIHGIARLPLDERKSVLNDIVEMLGDQRKQDVPQRCLGRNLQEQALLQIRAPMPRGSRR